MKVVTTIRYECEKCGCQYSTEEAAQKCEALPVIHNRKVKIGDLVQITKGEGQGQLAKVDGVYVTRPGWGPPAYDHSVYLTAKVVNSWGSRQLSFDSYEVVE